MKKKTIKNPHPGDVLKYDYLEELNISAYRLAKEIGVSESLISRILSGKKSITADTALRLSKYFDTTPDFWLDYQRAFDLEELEKENQKEYNKIKPLSLVHA